MSDYRLEYHTGAEERPLCIWEWRDERPAREVLRFVEGATMAEAQVVLDALRGWQPIETAPRDQRILVRNGVTGPYVTQFTDGQWPLGFWSRFGEWYPQPSHWRPLPDPPRETP